MEVMATIATVAVMLVIIAIPLFVLFWMVIGTGRAIRRMNDNQRR